MTRKSFRSLEYGKKLMERSSESFAGFPCSKASSMPVRDSACSTEISLTCPKGIIGTCVRTDVIDQFGERLDFADQFVHAVEDLDQGMERMFLM